MTARRAVGRLAVTAGVVCAGLAALTTAARYLPPASAPTAPDTWGMVTAFTDYGLAGYAVALVLLGFGLVLRRSRVGGVLTVLALVLSVLHASWVGPAFLPGPRPTGSGPRSGCWRPTSTSAKPTRRRWPQPPAGPTSWC